jgi:hypothetical protein
MWLDRHRLNLILAASDAKNEDSGQILIRRAGESEEDAGWCFIPGDTKQFYFQTSQDAKGDFDMKDIDLDEFLDEIKDLDVDLLTDWSPRTRQYKRYSDWDTFARAYGALDLETLSTEVPRPVAKYFRKFAEKGQGVETELRKLIYSYLEKEFKERGASIMFQE